MSLLSIIVPAYNEEGNIENTSRVLKEILEKENIKYELIFISDGSRDETFSILNKLSKEDKRVRAFQFSRNFGKEAAIFAGLKKAKGDACVVIDSDLQHPPEIIPKMFELWKQGYDVVEGVKSSRGKENIFHKIFAGMFYGIMSKLMKMDMKAASDYKLIDRKVVDILLGLSEKNTFFRALTFWIGFNKVNIEFDVQERTAGTSKWSFTSLLRYAISNTTSFTIVPLHMITVLGVLTILSSIVIAIQTLIKYFNGTAVEGFTTVILLILIIGGVIMLSLGILGHYLGRVYEEVKGRPRYIIKDSTDEE
jgi:dolichol-phosphate mannosyltransferase